MELRATHLFIYVHSKVKPSMKNMLQCYHWCNPSLASEIEHFEIFSNPQESQLP